MPVVSQSANEAAWMYGWLAPFVAADSVVSSALTQAALGWSPTKSNLLADMDQSRLFQGVTSHGQRRRSTRTETIPGGVFGVAHLLYVPPNVNSIGYPNFKRARPGFYCRRAAMRSSAMRSSRLASTVYYQTWAPFLPPIFLFAPPHVPAWTPDKPERYMRLCVNPDERRNAFWISLALLAADHPGMPRMGRPVDRQTRQRQIFKGQNPAGLAWLVSRMQQWPEGYKNSCWVACEELLSPPPTAVCEAVK